MNKCLISVKPGSLSQTSLFPRCLMIPPQEAEWKGCRPSSGPPVSTWDQCLSVAPISPLSLCLDYCGSLLTGLQICSHSGQPEPLKMLQWLSISLGIKP